MAADVTIAEVDEIVEAGVLAPNEINTPGIYVDGLVLTSASIKALEGDLK